MSSSHWSPFRAVALLSLLALAAPALAQDDAPPSAPTDTASTGDWQFAFAPYIWGAGLQGTVAAGGVEADFDVDFSDIFDALDIAFLGAFEARKGKLSLTSNLSYMKLSTDVQGATGSVLPPAPPGAFEVDLDMQQLMLEDLAGYEVAAGPLFGDERNGQLAIDVRGGMRAWWLSNEIDVELDPGSPLGPYRREIDSSNGWLDLVIGGRIRVKLPARLGLVMAGDVGGFGIGDASRLTWSASAFMTYGLSDHWELAGGWRSLDLARGGVDIRMQGPLIGALYNF